MAIPLGTIQMKNNIGRPTTVLIASAVDKKTGKAVSCGSPAWHLDSSGNIVIDSVAGLSPGGSYRLSLIILG